MHTLCCNHPNLNGDTHRTQNWCYSRKSLTMPPLNKTNPVGLILEVSAHQSEVRVFIPACIVIKTYCKTVPGLNFITNSHFICWIYHALSKIWRDRNITQTPGLRNTDTFRTRAALNHSALFPPVLLSSCTQGLGPLLVCCHLVLCCQQLGQPITHHPNQWLISASSFLQ